MPGVLIAAMTGQRPWSRTVTVGALASLSAAIVCGYYLLLAGLPFAWFLVASYGAVLVIWLTRRGRDVPLGTSEISLDGDAALGLVLILTVVLAFVSRSVPLFFSDVPPGRDPSFHALIAQKILATNAIPTDWLPFVPVALNYPIGLHILIAEGARLTGIPVHVVFKALFPALASLTAIALYWVALGLTDDRRAATFSVIAYSFLGVWGSLDYYRWGGLPNMLGMLLLLGLIECAMLGPRPSIVMCGLLTAALITSHHYSALCAAALLGGHALFKRTLGSRFDDRASRLAIGAVTAGVLSFGPLANYVRASGEVGQTSVLKFYEPLLPLWTSARNLGFPPGDCRRRRGGPPDATHAEWCRDLARARGQPCVVIGHHSLAIGSHVA